MGSPFGTDDNSQVIYIFYSWGIYNPGWRNRLYIYIYLCACMYKLYNIMTIHQVPDKSDFLVFISWMN